MNKRKRFIPMIALVIVIIASLGCEATSQLAPTPTPTITVPPTSTPTLTPTATPTAPPDISDAKIFLADLPAGFEELTPEEFGMDPADLKDENFEPEEIFIFINSTDFQIVLGFNFLLTEKLDRISFDTELNNPEILMSSFLSGLGTDEVANQTFMEGMDDIGEARTAMYMDTTLEGITMSMNVLVFRRDIVGGMVLSMYLEGNDPSVSIKDLGLTFDKNIKNTLGIAP